RVNLFKVAISYQTESLKDEIIDKKVWCDLMAIFTRVYVDFFGINGSVIGESITYVPNYQAVNALPIAIDLLYQLCVNSPYASQTRVLRYYALGVRPAWEDLHDFDSPVRYGVFKPLMGRSVREINFGLEMLYDDRLIDPEALSQREFDLDWLDPRLIFDPVFNLNYKYDDIRSANNYDPFIRRISQK
ncbi:MAG TPA: hypothetical protein VES89_06560, partial [Candidatus Competibacteraceae bacterium]|nr:hypothetical protein [Candidatus Competibacteraceae bacterium]